MVHINCGHIPLFRFVSHFPKKSGDPQGIQITRLDYDKVYGGLTFGNLSSLPNHLSQFGSVIGWGRASQPGLMGEVLRLLGPDKEGLAE